ncbi:MULTISPECIES: SPOR domain-containing protein [unclassified Pseudoalteromonas]|uniref:SPOR domain-containing protein n=1 Tax=unclassified Pseudoalteromonas TaxID=194690 RepID=UPI003014BA67
MQSQILPSRAALVDRIALQFEYGQNLITLVGTSGLGKSYLAESFLTDKYPEFNKAFVKLTANSSDFEVMRQLLEHSFRSPLIDQKLSLSENFALLHDEQPCGPCLWVLDNVRHLTSEMAEQLQSLATFAKETIYILATSQQPQVLPSGLDIHIEPLSLVESKRLMQMFYRELPPDEDPIFSTFLAEARGIPSVLLTWQPNEQLNLRPKADKGQRKAQWQWYVIALCFILTALMVAIVYEQELRDYWFEESEPQTVATALDAERVFQAQPSNVKELSSAADEEIKEALQPVAQQDAAQVASIVAALTATPKALDTNEEQSAAAAPPSEAKTPPSSQPAATADVAELLQSDSEPFSEEKANPAPEGNQWFLQQQDGGWVIQLLAVTEPAIAAEFMAQHADVTMHQFEVIRGEQTWYVVTSSAYSSLAAARAAKAQLPEAINSAQPFFKQVSKIKQEITQSLGN